jgi:hypothetical protein
VGDQAPGPRTGLRQLIAGIEDERLRKLDSLLIVPEGEDETPLNRIRRPPGPPSPKNFKDVLDRLAFVRSLGLPKDVDRNVHHNRLARLAREGAKTTPQHLRRFDPSRRQATLVAYLAERSAELSDLALEMHDRMIGALMNRAEKMRDEGFRRHGKAINEKVGLYARLGKALIAAKESGEDPYDMLDELMGWERFVQSVAEAEGLAMPANFDYLDYLEAGHAHVRRYAPAKTSRISKRGSGPVTRMATSTTCWGRCTATPRYWTASSRSCGAPTGACSQP